MSKHRLSPAPLPAAKRQHTSSEQTIVSAPLLNFDSFLYDELVLVIFSYLSWTDLCSIQPTNRLWARLASDNQLWKNQFIREYGRLRLRGSRGFIQRHDERKVKPLPHTRNNNCHEDDLDHIDWKWMFRISLNWRRGRCELERVREPESFQSLSLLGSHVHSCALLAGSLTVTTSFEATVSPAIYLHKRGTAPYTLKARHRERIPTYITALSLDQSPPSCSNHKLRVVVFYESGEFSVFHVDHNQPQHSRLLLTYQPRSKTNRTTPIRQAAYHHPLLVTLSHSFKLSLYDLSSGNVVLCQTLSSFTSYPPTSMVLTSGARNYRLVLAYSAPVYPSDWGAAVTVLTISHPRPERGSESVLQESEDEQSSIPYIVTATRTVCAFDVPNGWIDDDALRAIRDQWGRRAARVADVQTDGKWVVLAPADKLPLPLSPPSSSFSSSSPRGSPKLGTTACALQLYRLYIPTSSSTVSGNGLRLTFVRYLHGHTGPVAALALSDGRCVSRGTDGSIWVWDLERGWGVEVQTAGITPTLDRRSDSTSSTSASSGSNIVVSEGESEMENASGFACDEVPMGTPLGALVFDERRIITADAFGVEVRSFDI
ncbi:uncharacterized protein FOMMEDRAFT_168270 [Fomitiporia mediterranea MF3/22]|uniref:uncharacterized protein n=1 Tax=Fomitiporia mediterranea (strain MF3/22) TaxID=694068 RepID=UPI0004409BC0|nr:uncharacterized protein FOMMEDRAFT_168270 [Fomitiporia mediterranea MF3/22]EJD03257.1 hypothetical protein FOMMEDRAFT_168270 [Fomitiporia mediterranea MF3/22]